MQRHFTTEITESTEEGRAGRTDGVPRPQASTEARSWSASSVFSVISVVNVFPPRSFSRPCKQQRGPSLFKDGPRGQRHATACQSEHVQPQRASTDRAASILRCSRGTPKRRHRAHSCWSFGGCLSPCELRSPSDRARAIARRNARQTPSKYHARPSFRNGNPITSRGSVFALCTGNCPLPE